MRVLSWITRAKRPLSEQELTHALAFEPGDMEIDWTGIPDITTVIGACAGLVHVQTEAVSKGLHEPRVEYVRNITFAHYTIEVYIRQIDFSGCLDGDLDMVNTCLGYLALEDFEDASFVKSEYPFYSYAATHWLAHAAVVNERIDKDAALRVSSRPHWVLDALVDRKFHDGPIPEAPQSWVVAAAAIHGATYVLEILLDSGFQVNESFLGFTPLLVAVCYNHPDCISALLMAGADPNMTALGSWRHFGQGKITILGYERNWDSRSVLGTAASAGHSRIATILIKAGANLDGPPPPLVSAIRENEIAIVDQLLRAGCDPNVRSAYGTSALTEARAIKSAEMVRLLLDAGADPNMVTGFEAPLQSAAICGQWDIVRHLLLQTANPNLSGRPTMTALQVAAYEGKRDIIQLILKAHGDVNLTFGTASWMQSSKPPLHLALEGRHFDIAQTLIDAGANVNLLAGNPQYTALEFAVTFNHLGLIKRLLKAGANPNIGLESCPLLAAASRFVKAENRGPPKSTAVIRALLGAGADPGVCEGRFRECLRARAIDNVRYKWWRKEDPVVTRLCECESMLGRKQVGDEYFVVDFVEDPQVSAHAASAECDSRPNEWFIIN
jgi:ankyrin repeat protein